MTPLGNYVDAAGLRTYYEDLGEGFPLLLLHGGMATAESWSGQAPELAGDFRVLVPERRGHGRTPDVEGPITVTAMAADTIGFLTALGITSAHLVGWSDGALVAAEVARLRPDLVARLVVIGQYFRLEGASPDALALLSQPDLMRSMVRPSFDGLSPDGPEHFDVVFGKMRELWSTDPGFGAKQLAGITAPTLVMQGDHDLVRVEHSAAVAAQLGEAQLAVVPGTTHTLPMEKPSLVSRLIREFVQGP